MPSVFVSWGGTCSDPDVQRELVAYMTKVALECRARLEEPSPKRPAFLEKIVELETAGLPQLPPVIATNGAANAGHWHRSGRFRPTARYSAAAPPYCLAGVRCGGIPGYRSAEGLRRSPSQVL
jgi:hypothetical protein